MTRRPRISFVVPAFNEEAYLRRSLLSIRREIRHAGCDAEVIVVNNASTDATRELAASFEGVAVIDEPVRGLVSARSAGYSATTGELVANIDADTVLPRGWLVKVLRQFSRNGRLVALSGPYVYYDMPVRTNVVVRLFYCLAYLFYILNRYVLRVGSMMQGGNFVVRRDALEAIGGFNGAFSFYGEDTELARRLSAVGEVKFTFDLPALSSGRRLIGEGIVRTGVRYTMNFIWVSFLGRPFTEEWVDVRAKS
jgi:cellulose synthase/poly-beta-1,6-N-acetylglucosamine synthase-like glycosyltransferase